MNYIFQICLQQSAQPIVAPFYRVWSFCGWPGCRVGKKYFLIPPVSEASFHSSNREDAGVAQLVEHFLAKEDVARSSRVTRSTLRFR